MDFALDEYPVNCSKVSVSDIFCARAPKRKSNLEFEIFDLTRRSNLSMLPSAYGPLFILLLSVGANSSKLLQ
ncbi:hypothetical protein D3C73_1504320 [compost metagenome]